MTTEKGTFSDEINALGLVFKALEPLDDKQRTFIVKTVIERMSLPLLGDLSGFGIPRAAPQEEKVPPTSPRSQNVEVSPKDFLHQKKPGSDVLRVACLAYYLTHHRGQAHFKTRDLTVLNTEAAGLRLSNAAYAVNNAAKQNHFLAPAGQGMKQITPHGEEVVRALPDYAQVKALIESSQAALGRNRKPRKTEKKPKSN